MFVLSPPSLGPPPNVISRSVPNRWTVGFSYFILPSPREMLDLHQREWLTWPSGEQSLEIEEAVNTPKAQRSLTRDTLDRDALAARFM
jgi:hypothetical protein